MNAEGSDANSPDSEPTAGRRGLAFAAGFASFVVLTAVGWAALFWLALATGFTNIACGDSPAWTYDHPALAKLLVVAAVASAGALAAWAAMRFHDRLLRSGAPPGPPIS